MAQIAVKPPAAAAACARGHRLFVFVARLAQVDVDVHQAWRHHLPAHIAHVRAVGRPSDGPIPAILPS